jgi:ribosomal protein S18 acetylase RimI-like enzyme
MQARLIAHEIPKSVCDLFHVYPFKKYQAAFQGVDLIKLAEMHYAELLKNLKSGGGSSRCYGVFDESENVLAFSRLSESPWHTAVLGVPLYRAQPFLYQPEHSESLEPLVAALVDTSVAGIIEVKIDGSDREAGAALAGAGFKLIGISVKLSARREDLIRPTDRSGLRIRPATEGDLDAVKRLVERTHVVSHFYNQPLFPTEKVREMFAAWFEKCFRGLAEAVLVAEQDGRIIGFITLLVGRKTADLTGGPIGVVDFVGVDPTSQGKGIGACLLAEGHRFLERECRLFEIRTELDNYQAIRAYQRFGYRITSSDQVWHK